MTDKEFLELKNFISSLTKEIDNLYEDSIVLCRDLNELKYEVSSFRQDIINFKDEVISYECEE